MQNGKSKRKARSEPRQKKPGSEISMEHPPEFDSDVAAPGKKLMDKVALIAGGDSGIGRATAFFLHGTEPMWPLLFCNLNRRMHRSRVSM